MIRVSDDKHELYRKDGTPVMNTNRRGKVIDKSVHAYTVRCPDCEISAVYAESGDPLCPECGLVCDGIQGEEVDPGAQLVRDAKAAGRVISSDN